MAVTVTVPATTANLGPGFDCLGLALSLHSTITLQKTDGGLVVAVEGEGIGHIPLDESNLVVQAIHRVFAHKGLPVPGLKLQLKNGIPIASGLGSSAAAVLGGMLAANCLLEQPLALHEVLVLASRMEGHPDNVAPALYGGLVLVNQSDGALLVEPVRIPAFQVVVVLPEFPLSTVAARAALPQRVPLADAIFNVGRAALLVQALATGNYDHLQVAMQDRLHQPYRLSLIPGMAAAFDRALAAGAAGVALSGAGPGVVAFAASNHQAIGEAMCSAFREAGLRSRSWVLSVDKQGCNVQCS